MQQVYLDLYGSRLATVAAIQGHAPAAGCFLAMACDYRVMFEGTSADRVPTIGLNETQLGIAAPFWMGQMLVRTIGFRQAELALALGTLFTPKLALSVGLVDEVSPRLALGSHLFDQQPLCGLLPTAMKEDQAINRCMQDAYKQAQVFAKIPPAARVASKAVTRDEHLKELIARRQEDTDHFCGFVTQDAVQMNLKAYVAAMKKKSKK